MAEPDLLSELIARSALRDERAFAQLYRHTSAKLYAVALRILRRRDWAEEVLQESYVNIWNHLDEYSLARSAALTWMTAIVRNRALDWVRRPNLERSGDDYELLLEATADERRGPDAALEGARDAAALADCLSQLPASQRQSIALAYVNGLSHSELAEHLREPLGTVKTWIRRGLARLKDCLAQAG